VTDDGTAAIFMATYIARNRMTRLKRA
jgi:hypothetical protein